MVKTPFLAFLAAIVLPVASACASTSEPSQFTGEMGSLIEDARSAGLSDDSRTLEFLEDGVVTLEEYREGFADSLSCLAEHGIVIKEQHVNKLDSWRMMWTPDVERSTPQGDTDWSFECSRNHTMHLEIAYSLTAENRVDARLLAHSQVCLQEIGGELTGAEQSITDLSEATGNQQGVLNCLLASMQELFPDETSAYAG